MSVLFLDISSTSTGYAIATYDLQSRIADILELGFINFCHDSPHGFRYNILKNLILNDFYVRGTDIIVAEEYFINMKNRQGCLVVPELHGVLKSTCFEISPPIEWFYSKVAEWKKSLTGKARVAGIKGKKEKERIEKEIRKIYTLPDCFVNPITKQTNKIPSDVYDVLGILTHFFKESGAVKILLKNNDINSIFLGYEFKRKDNDKKCGSDKK